LSHLFLPGCDLAASQPAVYQTSPDGIGECSNYGPGTVVDHIRHARIPGREMGLDEFDQQADGEPRSYCPKHWTTKSLGGEPGANKEPKRDQAGNIDEAILPESPIPVERPPNRI